MFMVDVFGVLLLILKFIFEGVMYYFFLGYMVKVVGIEKGVGELKIIFSVCFGVLFMVWYFVVYVKQLGERIVEYKLKVWFVNIGWIGGVYGVGSWIKFDYMCVMIVAVLFGVLNDVFFEIDLFFKVNVLVNCEGVLVKLFKLRFVWKDPFVYDV